MEGFIYRECAQEADRRRKLRVCRPEESFTRMVPILIEMKALAAGVNTSVGAARSMDTSRVVENFGQSGFDFILNRVAGGLALPSGEICSVVGTYYLPAAHYSTAADESPCPSRCMTSDRARSTALQKLFGEASLFPARAKAVP